MLLESVPANATTIAPGSRQPQEEKSNFSGTKCVKNARSGFRKLHMDITFLCIITHITIAESRRDTTHCHVWEPRTGSEWEGKPGSTVFR